MSISSIFSVDMIARWKDFTTANVWLMPCFTTDYDIRLGCVSEAPNFYFLAHTRKKFIGTIIRWLIWDWIGCVSLDGEEESSGAGEGMLHDDSSLLAREIS